MLVLKRRRRQKLMIGDSMVTILSCSPNVVRLGIDSPDDTLILRHELLGDEPDEGGQDAGAHAREEVA